jgi:hypothetical protein
MAGLKNMPFNAQFRCSQDFTNSSVDTETPQVFVSSIYTTPHNANLPAGTEIIF